MYSGNDPNGDGFNSVKQYGYGMHNSPSGAAATATLNANGAGNGGDIDWAQLAQQWIQMRDNNTAATAPNMNLESQNYCLPAVPPPPPIISTMPSYKALTAAATTTKQSKQQHSNYEEQGEADMEMDEEIEGDKCFVSDVVAPAAPIITQQQWYGCGGDGSGVVDSASNQNNPQWNMWPPRVNVPPPPVISNVAISASGTNPTAHIPSLLKINVSNPNAASTSYNHSTNIVSVGVNMPVVAPSGVNISHGGSVIETSVYSNNSGIDANKRKMLPAWIREGLEKMEREKQKQMELQQQPKTKESSYNDDYETTKQVNHSPPVNLLQNIANSASESESGNESEDYHNDDDHVAAVQRGSAHTSMEQQKPKRIIHHQQQQQQSIDLIGKTYEQKLADLMIVVRRTLTELLLETTNEEIATVAHDVVKAHRKKASSAQVIRKSALSSITGKLGLAAYADSSSEDSSADSDNEDHNDDDTRYGKRSDNYDSGEELKTTIRNKKRAFAKTIEEIEENIAQAEEREEQQMKYFKQLEKECFTVNTHKRKYEDLFESKRSHAGRGNSSSGSNSKSTNNDFGETTTTTTDTKLKHQFNGKRMNRKERTTRFSDNKDGKNATAVAYNAAATSYISHLQQQQQQSAISTSNGNGTNVVAAVGISNSHSSSNQQQQKPMPVPNPATALLQMPDLKATTNSDTLNKADVVLEKAAVKHASNKSRKSSSSTLTTDRGKNKKKSSRSRSSSHRRRRQRSSSYSSSNSSSSTSTDKNDDSDSDESSRSSSSSSHHSKRSSRASSSKHHNRRHKDEHDDDDYRRPSSSRHSSSYHGSSNSKYEKDSKDRSDYDRRHHRDRSHERSSKRSRRHYSSESDDDDYRSSSRRRHHDKRRSRTRSRSRSRSNYSSSRSSRRRY